MQSNYIAKNKNYAGDSGSDVRRSPESPVLSLSNTHIAPKNRAKVKYWIDGQKMTVQLPKQEFQAKKIWGYRSKITKFTRNSRRRLLYKISETDKTYLPRFATLTYPDNFPTNPIIWKKHFDIFMQRAKRKFPNFSAIWKKEPQKRGAPHYHLLIWGAGVNELREWIPQTWYEVVNSGDINHLLWHQGKLGGKNKNCVSQADSWRGVMSYAAKYLGKVCGAEGWDAPGRFWGVRYAEEIPWSDIEEAAFTNSDAYKFMRLMRRYAKIKSRSYRSLTIFCNPDWWFENREKIKAHM